MIQYTDMKLTETLLIDDEDEPPSPKEVAESLTAEPHNFLFLLKKPVHKVAGVLRSKRTARSSDKTRLFRRTHFSDVAD